MGKYKCPFCFKELSLDTSKTLAKCPYCENDLGHETLVEPAQKIGNYLIKDLLGAGGMGSVYLAEQEEVGRMVALKVLQPVLAKNESYLQRFIHEVQTLAKIQHSNIVQAIEAGVDGDICYFAMMYIPGKDLMGRLESGEVFSEVDALMIVRAIAGALEYVWDKHKIIHRDIKPANIIVSPQGEVKLMDLGISKQVEEDENLTIPGMMVGSPHYISPEQARGRKNLDFRSDMYSLGATFYHLITGKTPYQAGDGMGVIACHLTEPVPNPCDVIDSISLDTSKLVQKMMAKDRNDRFITWDQAIDEMDRILRKMGQKTPRGDGDTSASKSFQDLLVYIFSLGVKGNSSLQRKARIYRLLFLLVVTVIAFGYMVHRSVRLSRKRSMAELYQKVVAFHKNNPGIDKAPEVIRLYEAILKKGIPAYSSKARAAIKEIQQQQLEYHNQEKAKAMENAWVQLEKASYRFERKGDFDNAIGYMKQYLKQGTYRDEFAKRIAKQIKYLEIQKEKMEKGLLNE